MKSGTSLGGAKCFAVRVCEGGALGNVVGETRMGEAGLHPLRLPNLGLPRDLQRRTALGRFGHMLANPRAQKSDTTFRL